MNEATGFSSILGEAADIGDAHHAAFRRVRIDIVELLKVGRIFRLADQRKAVVADRRILGQGGDGYEARNGCGESEARHGHVRHEKLQPGRKWSP